MLHKEAPDLYGFFINPALSSLHSGLVKGESQRKEWRNSFALGSLDGVCRQTEQERDGAPPCRA
jgi:hypothetical protein